MSNIPVTLLRNGTVYKDAGAPYLVLKYQHTKVGRGNATIKVKVKNIITGATMEKSFVSGSTVEEADVEKVKSQYLYRSGDDAVFMDLNTYDQINIPLTLLDEGFSYLKEGVEVYIFMFEGKPVSVELPLNVILEVTETEPGFKGDSATNTLKPAKVETGLKVDVPLFVKFGDRIRVDTRTGEYVERVQ